LHDQSDLVDVAVEHDRGRAARIDLRHAIASDVRRHLLGEGRRFLAPDARRCRLEAGWCWCSSNRFKNASDDGLNMIEWQRSISVSKKSTTGEGPALRRSPDGKRDEAEPRTRPATYQRKSSVIP
jgi:DNA-binding SARP family transcriptional activator